jgi:hypothetical protein
MKIIKKIPMVRPYLHDDQIIRDVEWDSFIVEGNQKTINKYFTINYPENEFSILEFKNNLGTFQVVVIPKEISKNIIDQYIK